MAVDVYITSSTGQVALKGISGYELLDNKASTYHKFTFKPGVVAYLNDFGIKSVVVVPAGYRREDLPLL